MSDKRLSITELGDLLGVHFNTIRQWEKQLDIVVPRAKDNHRSRYYTENEIALFTKIKSFRDQGLGIDNIKRYLDRDIEALEQEEKALEVLPYSEISTVDMREMIASIIIEHEQKLKEEFKKELQEELQKQEERIIDQVTQKQLEQIQSENNKLMDYIAITREEEKKKGFLSRFFNR